MKAHRLGTVVLVAGLLVLASVPFFATPVLPQSPSALQYHVYLPLVMRQTSLPAVTPTPTTAPTATPTIPASGPAPGQWSGLTHLGYPVSFWVSQDSSQWSDFALRTAGRVGPCNVTIAITVTGPGPITNNQFSRTIGNYSFSGQFSSPVNSAGWYTFSNYYIYGCGYLNQVGTWTAGRP